MSGSKRDFQSIGDAIREMLKTYQLHSRFDETKLINSWEQLVGKPIARHTEKVYMKNHVLFVKLNSPALKNDFMFHKPRILDLFRKEFGEDIIHDIVLI